MRRIARQLSGWQNQAVDHDASPAIQARTPRAIPIGVLYSPVRSWRPQRTCDRFCKGAPGADRHRSDTAPELSAGRRRYASTTWRAMGRYRLDRAAQDDGIPRKRLYRRKDKTHRRTNLAMPRIVRR